MSEFDVSIHAPVWVRLDIVDRRPGQNGFNSRTRVGATEVESGPTGDVRVSIHAPVWVRQTKMNAIETMSQFQFTHPCGCDRNAPFLSWAGLMFQFTHPCGCADRGAWGDEFQHGFNSRTRVGATRHCLRRCPGAWVSIHAPVWVRRLRYDKIYTVTEFQFTHPCGCDKKRCLNI